MHRQWTEEGFWYHQLFDINNHGVSKPIKDKWCQNVVPLKLSTVATTDWNIHNTSSNEKQIISDLPQIAAPGRTPQHYNILILVKLNATSLHKLTNTVLISRFRARPDQRYSSVRVLGLAASIRKSLCSVFPTTRQIAEVVPWTNRL